MSFNDRTDLQSRPVSTWATFKPVCRMFSESANQIRFDLSECVTGEEDRDGEAERRLEKLPLSATARNSRKVLSFMYPPPFAPT